MVGHGVLRIQSSANGEDDRLLYGVSAMQGWRISMEDAHTTVLDLLANSPKAAADHKSRLSFFGVFDGHGGDKVALFAGENIHNIIAKQDTFKAGNYEQALKDGFLATEQAILNGMVSAAAVQASLRVKPLLFSETTSQADNRRGE